MLWAPVGEPGLVCWIKSALRLRIPRYWPSPAINKGSEKVRASLGPGVSERSREGDNVFASIPQEGGAVIGQRHELAYEKRLVLAKRWIRAMLQADYEKGCSAPRVHHLKTLQAHSPQVHCT